MAASSSSVLAGEFRRGLKDAQNVVLNPWNGITATHEEPGTIANPTQQMVTEDIRGDRDFESFLDRYASRSGRSKEQQREQQPERA